MRSWRTHSLPTKVAASYAHMDLSGAHGVLIHRHPHADDAHKIVDVEPRVQIAVSSADCR